MAQIVYAARPLQGQALPAGPTDLILSFTTAPEAVQWLVDGVLQTPTSAAATLVLSAGSVVVRCRGRWAGRWTNHDVRIPVLERPGPETTGPRIPREQLIPIPGRTFSTPGELLTGLLVTGPSVVTAPGVTFRDCVFQRGTADIHTALISTQIPAGGTPLLVEFCELDGQAPDKLSPNVDRGIRYSRYVLRHCDVHHLVDGAAISDDALIEACWIHDLQRQGDAHPDCVQTTGGVRSRVLRSVLDCRGTPRTDGSARDLGNAAIMVGCETAPELSGLLIEGNWLSGGNYTLNVRDDPNMVDGGVVIRRNVFEGGARYGAITAPHRVVLEDNVTPTGQPATARRFGT